MTLTACFIAYDLTSSASGMQAQPATVPPFFANARPLNAICTTRKFNLLGDDLDRKTSFIAVDASVQFD